MAEKTRAPSEGTDLLYLLEEQSCSERLTDLAAAAASAAVAEAKRRNGSRRRRSRTYAVSIVDRDAPNRSRTRRVIPRHFQLNYH